MLQKMQEKFQNMSDEILLRIDDMGQRLNELEQNIGDLMQQTENAEEQQPGVEQMAPSSSTDCVPTASSSKIGESSTSNWSFVPKYHDSYSCKKKRVLISSIVLLLLLFYSPKNTQHIMSVFLKFLYIIIIWWSQWFIHNRHNRRVLLNRF